MHQTKYRPLPIKDRKTAFQMQDVFVRRSTAAGDYLVTCISAGHESADADGFGMEEEYDYYYGTTEAPRYETEEEYDYGTFEIDVTEAETIDVEAVWSELCEGMTPEEIASCEKEFEELGLSKEDIIALLYS